MTEGVELPRAVQKLQALEISTVELGTGNYPGDAHCKLTMLDDAKALGEFQRLQQQRHGLADPLGAALRVERIRGYAAALPTPGDESRVARTTAGAGRRLSA